ncbi:unnamed protein product [Calypogeia fissa]
MTRLMITSNNILLEVKVANDVAQNVLCWVIVVKYGQLAEEEDLLYCGRRNSAPNNGDVLRTEAEVRNGEPGIVRFQLEWPNLGIGAALVNGLVEEKVAEESEMSTGSAHTCFPLSDIILDTVDNYPRTPWAGPNDVLTVGAPIFIRPRPIPGAEQYFSLVWLMHNEGPGGWSRLSLLDLFISGYQLGRVILHVCHDANTHALHILSPAEAAVAAEVEDICRLRNVAWSVEHYCSQGDSSMRNPANLGRQLV